MLRLSHTETAAASSPGTGPVVTGAVTKLPLTGVNCSPSKQLLNSIFNNVACEADGNSVKPPLNSIHSVSAKLNNQSSHYVAPITTEKCLVTSPNNTQLYSSNSKPGIPVDTPSLETSESLPAYDPSVDASNNSSNRSKLRQSISHDSLLNLKLRKTVQKNGVISNAAMKLPPSNSSNNSSITNNEIHLNNKKDSSDLVDKGQSAEAPSIITNSTSCNSLSSLPLNPSLPDSLSISSSQTPVTSTSSLPHCKRCYVRPLHCHQKPDSVSITSPTMSLTGNTTTTTTTDVVTSNSYSSRYDFITKGGANISEQLNDNEQYWTADIASDDQNDNNNLKINPSYKIKSSKIKCTCANSLSVNTGSSTLKKLYNNIIGSTAGTNSASKSSNTIVLDNLNQLNNHHKNAYHVTSNLNDNVNSSKLYHKPFTLSKMRRSISKDSIDEKYWEFDMDDYLKSAKNLNTTVSLNIKTLAACPVHIATYVLREPNNFIQRHHCVLRLMYVTSSVVCVYCFFFHQWFYSDQHFFFRFVVCP